MIMTIIMIFIRKIAAETACQITKRIQLSRASPRPLPLYPAASSAPETFTASPLQKSWIPLFIQANNSSLSVSINA